MPEFQRAIDNVTDEHLTHLKDEREDFVLKCKRCGCLVHPSNTFNERESGETWYFCHNCSAQPIDKYDKVPVTWRTKP